MINSNLVPLINNFQDPYFVYQFQISSCFTNKQKIGCNEWVQIDGIRIDIFTIKLM